MARKILGWKHRLLRGAAFEGVIQFVLVPAACGLLLLLANYILAHR